MINNLLSSIKSMAEPVSWALLHSLWQGALVVVLLTLALIILRNKKATLRYAISCLALFTIVILFIGTVFYLNAEIGNTSGFSAIQAPDGGLIDGLAYTEYEIPDHSPAINNENTPAALQKLTATIPNIYHFWMLGVLLLSAYQYIGWHKTRRLTRHGIQPLSPAWQARISRLSNTIGIKYQIQIVKSTLVQVPCVIGWMKPVVLLPLRVFTGLNDDQLEMIIIHELAHIRRVDCLINYLQVAAETLLYFNPAVWWVSKQIRTERELCCDDLAVQISGNKLLYAKALVNLEEMRQVEPALAMRIDGSTSLLQRIRRLGGQTMQRNSSFSIFKLSGIIVLMIMLTVGVSSINGYTEPEQASYAVSSSDSDHVSDLDNYEGTWNLKQDDDGAYIQLKFKMDGHKTILGLRKESLQEIVSEKNGEYIIQYEAGTFYLEGFDKSADRRYENSGICTFKPNARYQKELEEMGFDVESDSRMISLAIHEIDLDFVRGIQETGYKDIDLDHVIKFKIHDITPEYIAHLKDVGQDNIPADKIVQMKIHDVEPEYVMKFKDMGYDDLDFDDLIRMSIHDVDPGYIKAFADYGYDDIDVEGLIQMSIHDVDPAYVKSFEEFDLGHIDAEDLIRMSIHDVDPAYIKSFAEMGYDHIDPEELIRMSIHDVDPAYVKSFETYGLEQIDIEDIIRMSIHDVDPDFINTYAKLGFENIDIEELIQMSIHDISADYITELAELGYADIEAEELVQMSIHDVTPEFIRELQRREFENLTPERLIRIKIHDLY